LERWTDRLDGLNPSEFSGKPRKDEVLTTNHISINSRILTRLYLSANASEGYLNKMLIFNNVVVILDGIVTNESEFLKKSSINSVFGVHRQEHDDRTVDYPVVLQIRVQGDD
jgi:hypothetical protein